MGGFRGQAVGRPVATCGGLWHLWQPVASCPSAGHSQPTEAEGPQRRPHTWSTRRPQQRAARPRCPRCPHGARADKARRIIESFSLGTGTGTSDQIPGPGPRLSGRATRQRERKQVTGTRPLGCEPGATLPRWEVPLLFLYTGRNLDVVKPFEGSLIAH